jgi:hypothetical protein
VLLSQLQLSGVGDLEALTLRLDDTPGLARGRSLTDAGHDGGHLQALGRPAAAARPGDPLGPEASSSPRRLVVLFGGEGVGKTSLLAAIASTRPGHAVAQTAGSGARADEPPSVAAAFFLGDDDPMRPHPLLVVSPNAKLPGERDDAALLRRREQALFDRRAAEGGFVLVAFSGARWFSRSPVLLTTPERTVLRHDARASASFDDATRADLTRETKQVLSFAAVSAALTAGALRDERRREALPSASDTEVRSRLLALDGSLRDTLAVLLEGSGVAYLGTSERTLEPVFSHDDRDVELDDLPRSIRHRVAFGALTVRALAAAYPARSPRDAEGVVLLDDLEVQQDGRSLPSLPGLLRRALPRVQWIVTTASPQVAAGCEVSEVMALRRMPGSPRVELHQGPEAVVH